MAGKKGVVYNQEFLIGGSEPVFTSGVVSRLLGIPVWTLKLLDREKLITPTRSRGKFRLYSKREVDELHHIWYLMKSKKVKVEGVRVILEMEAKMVRVSREKG